MLLYSALLALGLVVSAPWWVTRMLTTERYREGMRERLGRVPERLRAAVAGFGSGDGKRARVVWVHAVSVGEVLAASRLIADLEAALSAGGEAWRVVVSTTTRTGQALARERFGAERVFYFPLDFAWAVRAYMRVLRPAALVLMESEVWPRVLWECRRAGVPVMVVNARVSDRSFARGMKVRAVWGRVLAMVSLWLAQSEEDAKRLVAMGAREGSMRAIGNLKYDVRAPKESRVAELIKEAAAGRPIVVAGSTVSDEADDEWEDDIAIYAWTGKIALDHRALLVVAPRHPERFRRTEALAMPYRYVRASDWSNADAKTFPREGDANWNDQYDELEIVVVDTIGDLAAVYGVADIAFVGGSLVKRGGHNPLEPAQFGVPVVMGPSFENFRDVVAKMQTADAIRIVGWDEKQIPLHPSEQARRGPRFGDDTQRGKTGGAMESSGKGSGAAGLSTTALRASGRDDSAGEVRVTASRDESEAGERLEQVLLELLTNRDAAKAMGERGRLVFEEQQGATGRAVEAIVEMVRGGASR